jgi:hypothetical protein
VPARHTAIAGAKRNALKQKWEAGCRIHIEWLKDDPLLQGSGFFYGRLTSIAVSKNARGFHSTLVRPRQGCGGLGSFTAPVLCAVKNRSAARQKPGGLLSEVVCEQKQPGLLLVAEPVEALAEGGALIFKLKHFPF